MIATPLIVIQTLVWSLNDQWSVSSRVPFVVDLVKGTLEQLEELLVEVSRGLDGGSDWPPPQEKECMAVAALNLLNLQVSLIVRWRHLIFLHCSDFASRSRSCNITIQEIN